MTKSRRHKEYFYSHIARDGSAWFDLCCYLWRSILVGFAPTCSIRKTQQPSVINNSVKDRLRIKNEDLVEVSVSGLEPRNGVG